MFVNTKINGDFLTDEATESELPQQSMDDDLKDHEGFEVKDDSQSSDSNPDNEMGDHSDHDDSVEEPVYMRSYFYAMYMVTT